LRLFSALRRFKPSVSVVVDHGLDGAYAARLYQRLTKAPWILDTGDDIVGLGEALGRRGLAMWLTHRLDKLGMRHASRIVVRGRGHQALLKESGIASIWIPDGIDPENFSATPFPPPMPPSVDNPLTIGLVGSSVWASGGRFCYGQDLIEIVHHLRKQDTMPFPVQGIFIGDGSGIPHLQSLVAELGLTDSIQFLGRQHYSELPRLIRSWHVALSTQTNDRVGKVRTTGKLPIYLACECFILASRVGEAARVLPEEMLVDYDGSFDTEYSQRVARHIGNLIQKGISFSPRPELRELVDKFFSYNKLAETYHAVIEDCLRNPSLDPRQPSGKR
jgi:glycosyltransferase involved in cell wall biosynthesis